MARVDPLSARKVAQWEKAVADKTRELLEDARWVVEEEPSVGTRRPDLVLRSPEGATYVVEMKVGQGSSHFGSVAQVATFKEAYREVTGVEDVRGLLVTNMTTEKNVAAVAESLGVEVVSVRGNAPGEMAKEAFKQIQSKDAEDDTGSRSP
jgi:hypothetical protein